MSGKPEANEYVYISYPHDNSALLSQMEDLLKEQGYGVKYDTGAGVGKKRNERLRSMISASKACVCLLTESYAKAPSCMRELDAILDYLLEKRIVLAYVGDKERILSVFSLGMRILFEGMKGIETGDSLGLRDNMAALGKMIEDGMIERPIVRFGNYYQEKKERKKSLLERWTGASSPEEEWLKLPIEWIVLDKEKDGTLLLISKHALDCKPYHEKREDITWEDCTQRKWLNGEFLTGAFTEEEQKMIKMTHVENADAPGYGTDGGSDTEDRVFLLSITEAQKYFPNNEARQCKPTVYAVKEGTYVDKDNGHCWWWLRSPGGNPSNAACVFHDGSLNRFGINVHDVDVAVRPALWLILNP